MKPYPILVILAVVATVALGSLILVTSTIQAESQTDEQISEFRSDGVEVVHHQDGAKEFKITIEDSVGSSDDLR